jgi:type VI secretion system secreted protein Hcp
MASDYLIKLQGINGESKEISEAIELDSFSFGASNPADIGGKGLSAGKASLSDFTFTCALDSSSYQVLKNLYNGQPITTATFIGRKVGGGSTPYTYLQAIMTNCYVTSHGTGGGAQGVPTQSISFAYEQIQFEYYTQDSSSGAVTLAGSATYNITTVTQS